MTFVFNASPVIVLAKAGLLEAIATLGDAVAIPQAVLDEVLQTDEADDPAKRWFERSPSSPFAILTASSTPPFLAAWDLGHGESAVIAIAAEIPNAIAVLDDLAGRRCAQAHGIPIIGTLGLLLLAKKRGAIPSVAAATQSVISAGLYVSDALAATIRASANE
jgi:predicted nucleic acid-binding protein